MTMCIPEVKVEADHRVDVKIWGSRPTARILQSPHEAETATDFHALVEVSSYATQGRSTNLLRWYEGEVTLHEAGRGWQPCRSTQWGPDLGWMHGQLPEAVADLRRDARPIGIDVSRRLVEALSGAGWPAFAAPASSEVMLELTRDAVIPGDVVEHGGSRRRAYVLAIGRIHPDRTVEYLVKPVSGDDDPVEDPDETWWNSAHARRVTRPTQRDPYRTYLTLAYVEDDLGRQANRARRRRSAQDIRLPSMTWDRAYWRLCNLQRVGIDGKITHQDLGRAHWTTAANDCIDRRERAERARYAVRSVDARSP